MRGRLRHLLRDLAGRNDRRFVELLSAQVGCAAELVGLLVVAVDEPSALDKLVSEATEVEERADRHRDALIEELSRALTTPLDREDLFRLSRSLDDIVDNLSDFVDALALFEVRDASVCREALTAIGQGVSGLGTAIELLAGPPEPVTRVARSTKQGTRVRQAYLQALAGVFSGDDFAQMLKQRELLRRLDVVGLRFGEAADTLADAALKRA